MCGLDFAAPDVYSVYTFRGRFAMIVWSSMTGVPLRWIGDEDGLKNALTVRNSLYYKQANMGVKKITAPKSFIEYVESYASTGDKYIWLPRCFDFGPYLNPHIDLNKVKNYIPPLKKKTKPSFLFNGKLRETQVEPNNLLMSGKTGIICMGCGLGKSVLALHSATHVADKVLIVAHTVEILNQWKSYLLKFFDGVSENDIGWIQSDKFDWKKPFVLATLQTLSLKDFPETDENSGFRDYYDLVIYDEVHRLGAEHFRRAVKMFTANRWGLSATPTRRDSMDILFRNHIGEVIYTDLSTPLTPKIYLLQTSSSFNLDAFNNRFTGKLQYSSLDTALSEDRDRNLYIKEILDSLYKSGRKIIVVGNRNNQLIELWSKIGGGLLIGNTKYKKEREEAYKYRLIFGAYKIVSEGLDIPDLDTVVFISNFSDKNLLQQIIGRALRESPNKKDPKIFYMWDKNVAPYKNMGFNFMRYCKKNGYIVEVIDE